MIRLSLSLAIVLGSVPALALPATALARTTSPQAAMDAAPYTLRLDAPCASTITIEGAAGQDTPVVLDTPEEEAVSGLSLSTSGNEAILTGKSCQSSARLHVAPGTAIKASMHGFGALHISGVNGPVSITQNGSNDITLDQATALTLDTRGFGSFQLGWLNGPADLVSAGSGTITIARVDSPRLKAILSGFGSTTLQAGKIDTLTARISGSAHLRFDGTAHDADLNASGFGGIILGNVTGELHQEANASASISLQHSTSHRQPRSTNHPILTLPDGTVITAHGLIRPDGSMISFNDPEGTDGGTMPHAHHNRGVWILTFLLLGFFAYRHKKKLGVLTAAAMPRAGKASANAAACENLELSALQGRLSRLDERLGAVEHCVTSRDFHLHRQFHDLARRHG